MLSRAPTVLGLTLCHDVVVEQPSRNVSLIRSFAGLPVRRFPAVARRFCAFAAMTDGQGEAEATLSVALLEEDAVEVVYRVQRTLRFPDPLQVVYYVMRLSHCPLPRPGPYVFSLWLDGV